VNAGRRGFTLIELLISIVVLAFVGSALVRMMLSQNRFMDQQEAVRTSRAVARGSLNRLYSDIRNVEASGGVTAAAAGGKDITLRVPYAFGLMCATAANVTTVSLLPVDSAMYKAPGHSGFAWRNSAGVYQYVSSTTLPGAGALATCTGAGVSKVGAYAGSPAGQIVTLSGALGGAPTVGTVFFLYRRVRYEFKASNLVPGRVGLWRTPLDAAAANAEELAAPFDTTARVNFYVNYATSAQSAVPGALSSIRGLEFKLDGQSDKAPKGYASPRVTNLTTSIFFSNRPD
jgi:prepilin-type N-terminal cleavage/methylation domain-containing protein